MILLVDWPRITLHTVHAVHVHIYAFALYVLYYDDGKKTYFSGAVCYSILSLVIYLHAIL